MGSTELNEMEPMKRDSLKVFDDTPMYNLQVFYVKKTVRLMASGTLVFLEDSSVSFYLKSLCFT